MNRNYYQDQEIDCTCFDIHKKRIYLVQYHAGTIHQIPNMKKVKFRLHSSFINNNTIKIPIKKSLKKKIQNKHSFQTKNININTKEVATQTISPDNKKQNKIQCYISNKENRSIQLHQRTVTFSYSKHQQEHQKNKQKEIHSIQSPQNPIKMKIIECPSIHITNEMSIEQINNSIKKNYQLISKQNEQNKIAIKMIPSDVISESKTIKKKAVITPIKFRETNPTLTSKCLEDKTQKQLGTLDHWKKISIKAQGKIISSKKLKSMYPKQIQSFGEESISGFESEVLERGRFTWAPDSSQKSGEREEMTHTVHFRQTSSFSNATDLQGTQIAHAESH